MHVHGGDGVSVLSIRGGVELELELELEKLCNVLRVFLAFQKDVGSGF